MQKRLTKATVSPGFTRKEMPFKISFLQVEQKQY
jgi:hypothetical protein